MITMSHRAAIRCRWHRRVLLAPNRIGKLGLVLLIVASQFLLIQPAKGQYLPVAEPESVGFDSDRLAGIAELVEKGIQAGQMPGCVICFGRHGKIAYSQAFGNRQVRDPAVPMTEDTVFDMASITKPVATASSIMLLVERGQLRLHDRVVKYLPEFAPHGKDRITVHDLLVHQSGLIPDNPLRDYTEGPKVAWQRICDLKLVAPLGTTFKYSDVNFIVLAKLVEAITEQDVNQFSRQHIFEPLGMRETGFLPSDALRARAAPTEMRNEQWMRGEVHDPRAFELGGVAGHAGLFSTARDLAVYAQMMLGEGTLRVPGHDGDRNVQVFSPLTVRRMTAAYPVSSGWRGLGWDKQTGYSSNRGDLLSWSAFGHGGFTGTVLWIDPELDLFFIFLSNRVHPEGKGSVNHLAGQILNRVASSLRDVDAVMPPAGVPVLTGIDVLQRDNFRQLTGKRVGLITNHTGLNREGVASYELLNRSPAVQLTALFSPEHGFAGQLDTPEIADSTAGSTGLTVYSLYGKTRRPTESMLADVDVLVFDIQDIGTRFYTYISTMGEAMQAAAEFGKSFVVLDRPNPIGGVRVTGPMLDPGKESFVGFHRLPVRHGLTAGELAKLFQAELKLDLDLEIIACEGWSREATWELTQLMWVNPSPNMRSLNQAFLYPGIGLLETTNLSVGRGTDTPFEVVGAPWIRGRELAAYLNARSVPGVRFVPIEFTPEASKFEGEACQGVNVVVVDRDRLAAVRLGLEIAGALRKLYPDDWQTTHFNRLLGNDSVFQSIVDGEPIQDTWLKSQANVDDFLRKRQACMIYPAR